MKLTWIGPYFPDTGGSGADLRSYYLLRELCRRGVRMEGFALDSHGTASHKFFDRVHVLDTGRVLSGIRSILSGFIGLPFAYGRYYHPDLESSLRGRELVYINHLHMSVNHPFDSDVPVWLDEHNLEYELWQEYARTRPALLRPLLRWEAGRVQSFELRRLHDVSGAGIPSSRQRDRLPGSLRAKTSVIPNGVPEEWLNHGRTRMGEALTSIRTLGFIGSFDWIPNRVGVDAFLDRVWDSLRTHHPQLRLRLGGRNPPRRWQSVEGVVLDGFVESSEQFFDRVDALLVPLTIGSGTRLKILEAIARGLPVFSTKKGAEGLDFPTLPTAPELEGLEELIRRGLEDEDGLRTIREDCYQRVAERYRWCVIGECLRHRLGQIA